MLTALQVVAIHTKKAIALILILISGACFAQPRITSFSPASAPVGTNVTITGTNFSSTAANNFVWFGSAQATVLSASPTSLIVAVPAGVTYQPISVTTNGLTGLSQKCFSLTFQSPGILDETSFGNKGTVQVGAWPENIISADFDSDGRVDVAEYDYNSQSMSISRNISGIGNIAFAPRLVIPNSLRWIDAADIDGDGKLDIVGSEFSSFMVYRNTSVPGSISFATPLSFSAPNQWNLKLADMNSDGKMDVIRMGTELFSITLNTSSPGTISFSANRVNFPPSGLNYSDIAVADMNLDQLPDVVMSATDNNNGTHKLYVFQNLLIGGIPHFSYFVFGLSASTSNLGIADINNDGQNDVVTANGYAKTLTVLKNTTQSSITFDIQPDIQLSEEVSHVVFGNLNGDDKPDLALCTGGPARVTLLQNTSTGTAISFGIPATYNVGYNAGSIVAVDLDNDGKTDLASTDQYQSAITTLRNTQGEPFITQFSPMIGYSGTNLQIIGKRFTGTTGVLIGNISAASFTVINDTTINAVIANGASGNVTITAPHGSNSKPGFIYSLPPDIFSFSPTSAATDDRVIIKGIRLTGITSVTFGGMPARNFSVVSDSILNAWIADGSSGNVKVTSNLGSDSMPGFTYLPRPRITSFSPTSAYSGATVLIRGRLFSNVTQVRFGFIPAASFTITSDTTISAVVGNGASGYVEIFYQPGSYGMGGFTYLGPNISAFNPASAAPGTTITITGTNFTGATAVSFGKTPAASFTVISSTQISAVVGNGSSGYVSVTGPSGTGSRPGYIAPPSITSVLPYKGAVGTQVNITGHSFSAEDLRFNYVLFGGTRATVTANTDTTLTAIVPNGNAYLPISVSVNNLTAFSLNPFLTTFNGGPFIPASFSLRERLPLQLGFSTKLITADMNSDGKPDIVAIDNEGKIWLAINTGTASNMKFDSSILIHTATPGSLTNLAVADLNGDSFLDIIVLNGTSNNLSIFKSNSFGSNIQFAAKVDYQTGNNPKSLVLRDLTGDGKIDIAVSNYNSNTISVLRNITSTSSFNILLNAKVDYSTSSTPIALTAADFDGDGKTDLAVVNEIPASLIIFRNSGSMGNIGFTNSAVYSTGQYPQNISTGDLDNDGDIDIAVVNSISSSFSVYINISTSTGLTFQQKVDFPTTSDPNNLIINDLNGDGLPDLASSSSSSGNLAILKNISSQGGLLFDTIVRYVTAGSSAYFVTSGEINQDGKTDLIGIDGNGPFVFRNKFNEPPLILSFSPATVYAGDTVIIIGKNLTGITSASVGGIPFVFYEILNDSTLKFIMPAGSGDVTLASPYGSSTLAGLTLLRPPVITSFSPQSAMIGSTIIINGHNFDPLALKNTVLFGSLKAEVLSSTTTSISVKVPAGSSHDIIKVMRDKLYGTSTLYFNASFNSGNEVLNNTSFDTSLSVKLPLGRLIGGLYAGDVDGDGKVDINVSNYQNSQPSYLSVFRNTSSGNGVSLASMVNHQVIVGGGNIDASDLNGDGKIDFTIGARSDFYMGVAVRNTSNIGVPTLITDSIFGPSSLATQDINLGDFDADGRADIFAKGYYAHAVHASRNITSNEKIALGANKQIGNAVEGSLYGGTILVADLNNDNRSDAVIIKNNSVHIYRTESIGSMSFQYSSFTTIQASGGTTADLNNDGKIDLALINNRDSSISLYLNNSSGNVITFSPVINVPIGFRSSCISAADIDGDGKVDLITGSAQTNIVSILKNISTSSTPAFATRVDFPTRGQSILSIGDMDNDGKPEIVAAAYGGNVFTILRNRINEARPFSMCANGSGTIVQNLIGTAYQWQIDTGSGFTNLSNSANYNNTNTAAISLINVPSAWTGYKYRCLVDGNSSLIYSLMFQNSWNGSISNSWENPANWSCGSVPDLYTDVIITSGTTVINSNVTIRNLTLSPGVVFTVSPGYTLTITR